MTSSSSEQPQNAARRVPVKLMVVRAVLVVLGLAAWFATQAAISARDATSSPEDMAVAGQVLLAGDGLLDATSPIYEWLLADKRRAYALLISSSLAIDNLGFFLLGWSVVGPSVRPFVGLLMLFGLRQLMQMMSALPAPPGMIWEYPGFGSVLVTYHVANDFFFSGHTAIAVYGAVELGRLGGWKTKLGAIALAIFLAASVILVRAHWTMDVYAGAVSALLAASWAAAVAPAIDRTLARAAGVKTL